VRKGIREISDEITFHRRRGKFFRDRFPTESVGGRRATILCFILVLKSQKSFEVCTISIN
jgi:hypothetical protein